MARHQLGATPAQLGQGNDSKVQMSRWSGMDNDISDDQQDIARGRGMVDSKFQGGFGLGGTQVRHPPSRIVLFSIHRLCINSTLIFMSAACVAALIEDTRTTFRRNYTFLCFGGIKKNKHPKMVWLFVLCFLSLRAGRKKKKPATMRRGLGLGSHVAAMLRFCFRGQLYMLTTTMTAGSVFSQSSPIRARVLTLLSFVFGRGVSQQPSDP